MADQPDRKLELNPTQVVAASLGAVTSAVAASYLGVGGTLAGAGVGSVVATVGGAVYGHYLEQTRQRVHTAVARTSTPAAAASRPTSTPAAATSTSEKDVSTTAWLRSRRLALGVSALATFGLALGVITGVEAITRKPVSAAVRGTDGTGSSTLGELFAGGRDAKKATPTPTPTPTSGPTGPSTPAATPSGSADPQPTQTPGEGGSAPATAPSGSQAPTPAPTTPAPAAPGATTPAG